MRSALALLPLGSGGWSLVGCHEQSKRFVVLPADHAFLRHQDLAEERLVHELALLVTGCKIGRVAVLSPSNRTLGGVLDPLAVTDHGHNRRLGRGQLLGEALLLALEEIDRYRLRVVGSQECHSLVVELLDAFGLTFAFVLDTDPFGGQFVEDGMTSFGETLRRQSNDAVMVLDLSFDDFDWTVL